MEEEGEGKTAVDCTSVLRSVLRKGTFRLVIVVKLTDASYQ